MVKGAFRFITPFMIAAFNEIFFPRFPSRRLMSTLSSETHTKEPIQRDQG